MVDVAPWHQRTVYLIGVREKIWSPSGISESGSNSCSAVLPIEPHIIPAGPGLCLASEGINKLLVRSWMGAKECLHAYPWAFMNTGNTEKLPGESIFE